MFKIDRSTITPVLVVGGAVALGIWLGAFWWVLFLVLLGSTWYFGATGEKLIALIAGILCVGVLLTAVECESDDLRQKLEATPFPPTQSESQ